MDFLKSLRNPLGNGGAVIIRSPAPAMIQFLLYLASGDGSTDPNGELVVVMPPSPSNTGN